MLIPYLMLVLQTTLKTMQTVDMQKLDAYLQAVQNSFQAMQNELDGRFAKALTMLAVWGVALAVATLGYYYRRRGPCKGCGRGALFQLTQERAKSVV